jgi:hypothetical protein
VNPHRMSEGLPRVAEIPMRDAAPPRTALGRWFFHGGSLEELHASGESHPWYLVLWLTGVDYFSTLGYQPGIALVAAGAISPVATAILVLVTLFGALPIYSEVARRSYAGQGSIAMLENLLPGWTGKLFVLALLGFAATDFVITMTLSAADAAQHAIENPFLHPLLGEHRVLITVVLLALLAAVFLRGFTEAIGLAAAVAIPYLLLNAIVLARGLAEIWSHPDLLRNWREALALRGDWTALLVATALVFPRLALGMSGFETGVSVMPLVKGKPEDRRGGPPLGVIAATRKLLASAAAIMSVLLLASSFVTALLVPPDAYRKGGEASGRAIAYLAHHMFGDLFGSLYDAVTIAILWFAGASAMAGMLNLIPRYLPRFGMAPRWVSYRRALVTVLFAVDVAVTLVFHADVDAQGGAYATGVLALMLSAAIAVALALWQESRSAAGGATRRRSLYFWAVSGVFAYTLADNVVTRPDGVIISALFIAAIVLVGLISRSYRATELRVVRVAFTDDESSRLWATVVGKKANLVPLRTATREARARKNDEIRRYYSVRGPLAFIHVDLLDNRSEFISELKVRISRQDENFVIDVSGAISVANTIAYVSELIDPISIFLGLTRQNLIAQALRFLLWGEGETAILVYAILLRYWDWTPEDDVRPLIFLMSE